MAGRRWTITRRREHRYVSAQPHRFNRLDLLYRDYLQSEDTARFIADTTRCYTIGTLVRLAEYGTRVSRRAAILAIGFIGDYSQNDILGRALLDRDRAVRLIAENGIKQLWQRDGNPEERMELAVVLRLLHDFRYNDAYDIATQLLEKAPDLAEAWNQRAIACYRLERIEESAQYCHQALELNPYHFQAAIGMGNCYLELNDAVSALSSFQRALRLNPSLDAVRVQVEFLQRSLEGK